MRRSVLLLCAALLALGGCGRPTIDRGTPAAPPGPAAPGGAPTGSDLDRVAAPPESLNRDTRIFIAVLRRYLATDTSFPPGSFDVVFVLDHTEVGVDDPFRSEDAGSGPAITEQRAIIAALADLAKVEFVPTRKSVIRHQDNCAVVRDGGILITLSRPEGTGDEVRVPIFGYVACLGATWLTYVVARSGPEWEVTGTTGTMGIS
jgi:hypothetical protein